MLFLYGLKLLLSTLGSMWKLIKVLSKEEVQVVIKNKKPLLGKKRVALKEMQT